MLSSYDCSLTLSFSLSFFRISFGRYSDLLVLHCSLLFRYLWRQHYRGPHIHCRPSVCRNITVFLQNFCFSLSVSNVSIYTRKEKKNFYYFTNIFLINWRRVGLLYVKAIKYSELVNINTFSSYLLETFIQLFTLYGHINLTLP